MPLFPPRPLGPYGTNEGDKLAEAQLVTQPGRGKSNARVRIHKAYGSVWEAGQLIAGYRPPLAGRLSWEYRGRGEYSVLLCLEPREIGPRGGVTKPACSAEITAHSWAACIRAIRGLGFTAPALTAREVRGRA